MNNYEPSESDTIENEQPERRPYQAPTVTDFFQPLVALGTTNTDLCAAPKPPKKH